ncbi:hypothetical protein B0H13DRAFT_2318774 [Mycena leptocephala]|nr:hypothetical protein B0H13DRAFT_2318774 [Mycena leptocephala]
MSQTVRIVTASSHLHLFPSILSTTLASPASIPLLQILTVTFPPIFGCAAGILNALAHDILLSMARPDPSPSCDGSVLLSGAISVRHSFVLFPLLPRPLPLSFPFTVLPPSSTFDPPHLLMCQLAFPPVRALSRASSNKNASRRTTAPPRRRVPNAVPHAHPAHPVTHSPPVLALSATYIPARGLSCATPPHCSKLAPAVHPHVRTAPPRACAAPALALPRARRPLIHLIPGPREHRPSPAIAARPLRPFFLDHHRFHTVHAPGIPHPPVAAAAAPVPRCAPPPPSPPQTGHLRGEPMHPRLKMSRSPATATLPARHARVVLRSLSARCRLDCLAVIRRRTQARGGIPGRSGAARSDLFTRTYTLPFLFFYPLSL